MARRGSWRRGDFFPGILCNDPEQELFQWKIAVSDQVYKVIAPTKQKAFAQVGTALEMQGYSESYRYRTVLRMKAEVLSKISLEQLKKMNRASTV